MGRYGFSSLNRFRALTWSASRPRSHPKRRSIATPALKPNAPARCWNLAGEYASASATASAPNWSLACCRQPPNLVQVAHLDDPRCPSCVHRSVLNVWVLVAPGPHPAPLRSHGPDLSVILSSNGFLLLPSWRFRLRVVHGILRSVLVPASPQRDSGIQGILPSTRTS